jgi:hypothetical protein
MINSISNFLPSKLGKQTNSKNNYDKFNNYCFQICEIINDNCVKLDVGEENYVKILGYLHSSKWDKIIQNNCKHYFYNDLQLIINEYGDQWCKKDKIFSYNTLKNDNNNEMDIRISLYRTNKIPTEIFPPITKYNDIRKIRKTRFIKKNVSFEILVIGHRDKYISYEVKIYGNVLSNVVSQFTKFMKNFTEVSNLKFTKMNSISIDNYDISKLSLSII